MGKLKPIKILGLSTHYTDNGDTKRVSGVDYARIINPLEYLKDHPDFEIELRNDPVKGYGEKNWDELTKKFDIIYSSYIDSPWGYVNLALWSRKNGCIWVTDVDDNLWQVPKPSPVYKHYHPGSEQLHFVSCSLEDTPYLTTTNMFLKRRLSQYVNKQQDKIKVLPNYIDLSLYDYKKLIKKPTDKIILSYAGTSTHLVDVFEPGFKNAITRILKEFPNVEIHMGGLFLVQLKTLWGHQYKHIMGKSDVYDYAKN